MCKSLPLPHSRQCTILSPLKKALNLGFTLLERDSSLVFLCGANKSPTNPEPVRDIILQYAKRRWNQFLFFRAEEVFNATPLKGSEDLLTLEDRLGDYSDCIIIVCESESAFAELGAFALRDNLAKNVLVINDNLFRSSQSFITLGPISRIDHISIFKPTVYADFRAILRSANEIENRLKRIQRFRRRKIKLSTKEAFQNADAKIRLLLLADIIHLLSPVKKGEVISFLKFVYGGDYYDVRIEIALLISLGILKLLEPDLLQYIYTDSRFFIDYSGVKPTLLRSSIIRHYFQFERTRLVFQCGI